MKNIARPSEVDPQLYYNNYLQYRATDQYYEALARVEQDTIKIVGGLSEEQANYRYAAGKWSIKQVVKHIADCERMFAYRALHIAREPDAIIHGMDENIWADRDNCDHLTMAAVLDEFKIVRKSSRLLFEQMDPAQLDHMGTASGLPISPRRIAWVLVGHNDHHNKVLKERYL